MPNHELTPADRVKPAKVADAMARAIFRPPGEYVRDGTLYGVTEEMLSHLLEQAFRLGFDCAVETIKEVAEKKETG